MLFITFELGADRYALEARRVIEVLPFVDLERLSEAPAGVAGFFRYRGRAVPAVDLCQLLQGRPARPHFSTRLLVLRYRSAAGAEQLVGLIAERATGLLRREAGDFVRPDGTLPDGASRRPVALDGERMVQWLDADLILPETLRRQLALSAHDAR